MKLNGQALLEMVEGRNMSLEHAPVSRQFLLKQLENEIDAAFSLVSAARKAYRQQQIVTGDDATQQAFEKYRQAKAELAGSTVDQVRAYTHQLTELRQAIDWLRETHDPNKVAGSSE
jgi:hypothetical protein